MNVFFVCEVILVEGLKWWELFQVQDGLCLLFGVIVVLVLVFGVLCLVLCLIIGMVSKLDEDELELYGVDVYLVEDGDVLFVLGNDCNYVGGYEMLVLLVDFYEE